MKKFTASLLCALSLIITPNYAMAADCDKAGAQKILDMLREGVGVKFEDHGVNLFGDIDSIWNEQSLDKKNQLLRTIADADACIQGKAQGIMVYAWGQKVAEASPLFGLKVIK
ncbi:MAG: hypothetical protein AB9872_04070 [Solidesulfovibrio sp.]